jgi:hypothetical protein
MFAALCGLVFVGNASGADFSPLLTGPVFAHDCPFLTSVPNQFPENPQPDSSDCLLEDDNPNDVSPAKRRLEVSEKFVPGAGDLAHGAAWHFRSSFAAPPATSYPLIYLFCRLLI